jgi:hypothetical protein
MLEANWLREKAEALNDRARLESFFYLDHGARTLEGLLVFG